MLAQFRAGENIAGNDTPAANAASPAHSAGEVACSLLAGREKPLDGTERRKCTWSSPAA